MQTKLPISFVLLVFLLPSFVQRIFIGGAAESYDSYSHLSIEWLGYIANMVFVGCFFMNGVNGKTGREFVSLFYLLMVLNAVHIFLLLFVRNEHNWSPILANIRQTVWLVSCAMASLMIPEKRFISGIIKFTEFTIVVILISRVVFEITGIPLQTIITNGTPRAQGFLSEPSTFACILAGYIAMVIRGKNISKILIAILALFAANSAIAYVGVLVSIGAVFIKSDKLNTRIKVVIGFVLWALFWFIIMVLVRFSKEISKMAVDLMVNFEETSFGGSILYTGFLVRWLEAISQIGGGIEMALNGDISIGGGSYRFLAIVKMLIEMSSDWSLWMGDGLGIQAQSRILRGETALEFGFLPLAISSFGIILGVLIHLWVFIKILAQNGDLYRFALPCFIVSSLNSGGGFHMYSISVVAALYAFRSKENLRTLSSR
jgi:hypothetical protein